MPPKSPTPEPEDESWMTTYADAITLLMAFFVMLLNFSKIDIPRFEEVAAGIANEIGMGTKEVMPITLMQESIVDVVYEMQADEVVDVQTDDKGITIELASSAFYQSGSAEFRPEAIPVLTKIGQLLISPRYTAYMVEVEGHTDDDPIKTARYPSNWELSAGRATRVVRFMIQLGMDYRRLSALAYAETRPKYPNRNADGTPNIENQTDNRRIILSVYPMSLQDRAQIFGDASYGLAEQSVDGVKGGNKPANTTTGLPKKK